MFRKIALTVLASAFILGAGSTAEAKTYATAKQAALRQGAYRFSRNNVVRGKLGILDRKRVTATRLGTTRAGNTQYVVKTRKYLNGEPATTKVTVRQLGSGLFKPYSGKAVSYAKKPAPKPAVHAPAPQPHTTYRPHTSWGW